MACTRGVKSVEAGAAGMADPPAAMGGAAAPESIGTNPAVAMAVSEPAGTPKPNTSASTLGGVLVRFGNDCVESHGRAKHEPRSALHASKRAATLCSND